MRPRFHAFRKRRMEAAASDHTQVVIAYGLNARAPVSGSNIGVWDWPPE
jgi:hypothetical protein